eukprot:CAMPEP_0204522328 /NCGR_PEP_ID=MMETSP0661-20131031/6263_1 /ASSEMBLY_ACC=CAM_ASM_000606 /TAXON_ID=109239 /ORGANISM="Alexandrium margalefi, Strain AMGDE01CS-322" /LENGTH=95 /DNA_ID=CAMNT_0051527985 /DNA_START=30 /DNA_END=315 /DNA_ORIENTATION=-
MKKTEVSGPVSSIVSKAVRPGLPATMAWEPVRRSALSSTGAGWQDCAASRALAWQSHELWAHHAPPSWAVAPRAWPVQVPSQAKTGTALREGQRH